MGIQTVIRQKVMLIIEKIFRNKIVIVIIINLGKLEV